MSTYLDFFSLNEDPFRLTPDPDYYFPSQEHSNALHSLDFTMNNREGFCLLTGDPGTGKTTLLRIFLEKWQDKAELALVMTPRLNPAELLEAILADLEVILPLSGNKNDMIMEFRDFLLSHASNGRQVAIIVDEAQNLPTETLEELRLLSNLETEKQKLLQIILIGQTELSDKLALPELRQLNQRISVRASLSPLPSRSTSDYMTARLLKAGSPGASCFEKNSHELIHKLSGGVPRLINLIASRSLMAAFLEGRHVVQERQIKIAAEEVLRQERKKRKTALRINWWAAAMILLLVVAIIVGIAIWVQLSKLF
jgi:general secretion pathway protein A